MSGHCLYTAKISCVRFRNGGGSERYSCLEVLMKVSGAGGNEDRFLPGQQCRMPCAKREYPSLEKGDKAEKDSMKTNVANKMW